MRARGLLAMPSPHPAGGDRAHAAGHARGFGAVMEWVLRGLRRNFFDRFGRGGGNRQSRAAKNVTPSP